jgi:hypothetical protein
MPFMLLRGIRAAVHRIIAYFGDTEFKDLLAYRDIIPGGCPPREGRE